MHGPRRIMGALLAVVIGAFIWAKLKVEIEGKDGWAKNLPSWRIEKHFLIDIFMGGRALTGYHAWAFTFLFFVFHWPFFWQTHWTVERECFALGCIALFCLLEDFFWFLINPRFGWKAYSTQKVEWHRK